MTASLHLLNAGVKDYDEHDDGEEGGGEEQLGVQGGGASLCV